MVGTVSKFRSISKSGPVNSEYTEFFLIIASANQNLPLNSLNEEQTSVVG